MDFDLARREKRLAREQAKRRGAAREKSASARRREASAKARQEELAQRLREKEEVAAQEAERRMEQERQQREEGGGVLFRLENLEAYHCDGEDDRVLLPQSALAELSNAGALQLGPLAFELQAPDGAGARVTRCGVREFTAEEGRVGLPVKVFQSLFTEGGSLPQQPEDCPALPPVSIRFVVLPKATSVTLQPKGSCSIQAIPNVKAALEANLRFHTTISAGDWLQVWHRGRAYQVEVMDTDPSPGASLIDTDVEVIINEFDHEDPQAQARAQAEAHRAAAPAAAPTAAAAAAPAAFSGEGRTLAAAAGAAGAAGAGTAARTERTTLGAPPEEPGAGEPHVAAVRLRLPGGRNLSRRFRLSDPLEAVLLVAATAVGENRTVGALALAQQFPRRRLTLADARREGGALVSLEELGFGARELFVVERI